MTDTPRRHLSQADARYGAAASRRLLINTIKALQEFAQSATVVGAHAVHVWVEQAWGPIEMEATRDGDVVINPVFVAESPKLLDLMGRIGAAPALPDRPGVYGYVSESELPSAERITVDLIVPEAYAGPGRRAARIPGQGNAATRALGLELGVWDRHPTTLSTVDGPTDGTRAFVAGPAALLVAKAHKVHERLQQVITRPDRLRPKDSGDVALLMMVSSGEDAAETMSAHVQTRPEIRDAVTAGATYLLGLYDPPDSIARLQAADALAARFEDTEVFAAIDAWLADFQSRAAAADLLHS